MTDPVSGPARPTAVLVLDSGIGGMTVVRAIRRACPGTAVTYLADSAWFPYGRLSPQQLTARVGALVAEALAHWRLDAVVIACNTATTIALDALRPAVPVPMVGVVPPVKTAAAQSRSRTIALLATEGTIRTPYVDRLIASFAADCRVVRVGCRHLAALAEDKARGLPVDAARLRADLAPLLAPEAAAVDVAVLGCTHYPILRPELEAALPAGLSWLDPAEPVARRLAQVLAEAPAPAAAPVPPQPAPALPDVACFTGPVPAPELEDFAAAAGFTRLARWPFAAAGLPRPVDDGAVRVAV